MCVFFFVFFLAHFNLAGAAPLAASLTPGGVEWLCTTGGSVLCGGVAFSASLRLLLEAVKRLVF